MVNPETAGRKDDRRYAGYTPDEWDAGVTGGHRWAPPRSGSHQPLPDHEERWAQFQRENPEYLRELDARVAREQAARQQEHHFRQNPPAGRHRPAGQRPSPRPRPTSTPRTGGTVTDHKGHPALITPYNTPEFEKFIRTMSDHHRFMSPQAETVGVDLRKLLAKPFVDDGRGGKKEADWYRADFRLWSRLVARPFAHIAAANDAIAKEYRQVWKIYLRHYAEQPANRSGGRPGFTI